MRQIRYRFTTVPEQIQFRGKTLYVFPESAWAKRFVIEGERSVLSRIEEETISSYLSEGDTAIDVGSFVGSHTLLMSDTVGDTGHVYAFEPQPACLEYIERTLETNQIDNCTITNAAVGETDGTVRLHSATRPTASATLADTDHRDDHTWTLDVPSLTLETFVRDNGIDSIELVKLDIQGGELSALRGMTDILDLVDAILFEIHTKYVTDPEREIDQIFDILAPEGDLLLLSDSEREQVSTPDQLYFDEYHPLVLWESS